MTVSLEDALIATGGLTWLAFAGLVGGALGAFLTNRGRALRAWFDRRNRGGLADVQGLDELGGDRG